MSDTWRPIRVFVIPVRDIPYIRKPIANSNEPRPIAVLVKEPDPDDDPPTAA